MAHSSGRSFIGVDAENQLNPLPGDERQNGKPLQYASSTLSGIEFAHSHWLPSRPSYAGECWRAYAQHLSGLSE